MSSQTVAALEFARNGEVLRGSIGVATFSRLDDKLFDRAGLVDYLITGSGPDDEPVLNVAINGSVNLRCERCLGALATKLSISSTFRIAETLPDLADEADDVETLAADERVDVAALIEDEILLSLPIAPKHEVGVCRAAFQPVLTHEHAFSSLEALKKH